MAIKTLAIPTDESGFKVELAYLERWPLGDDLATPLSFLVRERVQEGAAAGAREDYMRNLPVYRREFGNMLEDRRFEVVISPPSTRADFEPYRKEVVDRGIARMDLTDCFTRSTSDSTRRFSFDEMIDALDGDDLPSLADTKSVLIVDDYFVTGRTAAALLSIIRSRGFPRDGDVTVACPLWLSRGH